MSTKAELFPGESILSFIHQSQHRKLFASWHRHYNQSEAVPNIPGKQEDDYCRPFTDVSSPDFFLREEGTSVHRLQYYTPSIWWAADWARFPCNHRTLLPWCPWHKQALFNLLMDIHIMVNWQCQKKIHWPLSHDCIMGSSVHLTEVTCFVKVICWPLVVLVNSLLSYMISGAIISGCFTIIVLKRPNISVPARKLCLKAKVAPTTHFWGPDISRKGQCTSISLICKREETVGKLRKWKWQFIWSWHGASLFIHNRGNLR